WYRSSETVATNCPTVSATSTSSPNRARRREPASSGDSGRPTPELLLDVLVLDLLLELHDAVQERLGPRRTARHEHVDGDDLVAALRDRVAVPVGAAAVRA